MNNIKKILLAILALIIIWSIIFCINYIRCRQLKEPIFCEKVYYTGILLCEDQNGKQYNLEHIGYNGVCYNIDNYKISGTDEFVQSKMSLFQILIHETSQDFLKEKK